MKKQLIEKYLRRAQSEDIIDLNTFLNHYGFGSGDGNNVFIREFLWHYRCFVMLLDKRMSEVFYQTYSIMQKLDFDQAQDQAFGELVDGAIIKPCITLNQHYGTITSFCSYYSLWVIACAGDGAKILDRTTFDTFLSENQELIKKNMTQFFGKEELYVFETNYLIEEHAKKAPVDQSSPWNNAIVFSYKSLFHDKQLPKFFTQALDRLKHMHVPQWMVVVDVGHAICVKLEIGEHDRLIMSTFDSDDGRIDLQEPHSQAVLQEPWRSNCHVLYSIAHAYLNRKG